ncbi:MAG: hypothetical protein J6S97_02455 [Bacteroidales bacterium]|nr:hypothetical protein [Bacteroidales bacterium]
MKSRFVLMAAAALVLAACAKESTPVKTFSFTASFQEEPSSKAVLGRNNNKPQTLWENGDAINIFSSGSAQSSTAGFQFTTTLGSNSISAEFSYTGDDFEPGEMYFATYPYRSNKRGVNFTGSSGSYRLAGLQIPSPQTLVADNFDKEAALSVAFAEGGSSSLSFKNATALLKFRVSDADVTGGRITADNADALAGTFRADVDVQTKELSLQAYGQPTTSYVEFAVEGNAPLATGTDYYVAVKPGVLSAPLKIYLNDLLVKTIDIPALERSKIYNLGTLTLPEAPQVETKTLVFDFSGEPLSGWPTTDKWQDGPGNKTCIYPLDGTNYEFLLTECGNATQARVAWSKDKGGLVMFASWRYIGLPAIAGYKLVKLSGFNCLTNSSSRKAGIVTAVAETNVDTTIADAHTFVSGGGSISWPTGGQTYSYNLEGTTAGTRYYFMCTGGGIGVSSLELVYEKVQ